MTAPVEPTPQPELVEPGPPPCWWDETPAEAARYDRMYWNED
ncbi:hypothetical protein [Streptomyces sp. NPDC060027]